MQLHQGTRRLKVSLIVSDLSSSGSGRWGGAIRPFLLAQALQKLDCQVEMLGLAYDDDGTATIEACDLPVVSFPCQYHSGAIRAAHQLIRRIDGDIIYAVKLKPSSFGLALVKKMFSHRPLILDIDDWELSWYGGDAWQYGFRFQKLAKELLKSDGALRYPDHPLYLKWLEGLVSSADAVTTHTTFLQNRFGGLLVPNGKDTDLFAPERFDPQASRAKYGLAAYRILMFPGAPRPYKGLEDILTALEQLNQPDLRLVIVGGSPYDDYDRELSDRWGRWIVQLPKHPVETMPELVSAAHVIVVPQRDSPATKAQFPLKLTDGMAMAKPVLATRVGDLPQILGSTGYLVEPNNSEQMATQIEWIFTHLDEANALARKARKRCIDYYSIDSMAAKLAQIISSY